MVMMMMVVRLNPYWINVGNFISDITTLSSQQAGEMLFSTKNLGPAHPLLHPQPRPPHALATTWGPRCRTGGGSGRGRWVGEGPLSPWEPGQLDDALIRGGERQACAASFTAGTSSMQGHIGIGRLLGAHAHL